MNGMTIGVKVPVEQIGQTCWIQQYLPSLWFMHYVACIHMRRSYNWVPWNWIELSGKTSQWNSVPFRLRMQLSYTKLKQQVRQFIHLPDTCAYLFLFVLIYLLSAMAVILKLIVLICPTVINDTIIHRMPCATAFSMKSWLVCRLCTTPQTKCCGVVIVIGQYCITYSLQMAKHNLVTNMKCMHKKEYCKYNI